MPTINGQRVLSTSPLAQSQLNSRGGINKVSNREARGDVSLGSTGVSGSDTFKAGTVPTIVPPASLSVGNIPAPEIPKTVPAEALSGDNTIQDVFAKRNQMEKEQQNTLAETDRYNTMLKSVNGGVSNTIFSDPEKYINSLLLGSPTTTQTNLDAAYSDKAANLRQFSQDYQQSGIQFRQAYGLPELQQKLADTRTQIADRNKLLREDLRKLEVNAEARGVAREFVDDAKRKINTDALAELADLALIEAAQSGNVEAAKSEVDRLLAEKKFAFEYENDAVQAEIDRLKEKNTDESNLRAERLKIALDERTRLADQQLANEKENRSYLIEAANNGADQETLNTIRNMIANNVSPEEVAYVASPFIGQLDRQLQQAQLANTYSQISSRELGDTIALAEKGDAEAISKLGFDPRSSTGNFEAESSLRKEFNTLPTVEEAVNVQQSYKSINSALQEATDAIKRGGSPAAADQALIISFNKMLDPTSVVREGEFARSTQGQAILAQLQAKVDAAIRGGAGLTDQMRQEIVNTTGVLYNDYVRTHNDTAYDYRQNALRQGADPKYVAGYIDTTTPPDQAQDGDILVINGIPMEKQGDQFIPLDI